MFGYFVIIAITMVQFEWRTYVRAPNTVHPQNCRPGASGFAPPPSSFTQNFSTKKLVAEEIVLIASEGIVAAEGVQLILSLLNSSGAL